MLLIFSMKSITEYVNSADRNDQPYLPSSGRNHHLTDAIAIPCLYGKKNNLTPNPDHVELKFAGSSVVLKNDGDVMVDVAKDLVATVAGNSTETVTGNSEVTAGGTAKVEASGNVDIKSGGTANVEATAAAVIKAPTITLGRDSQHHRGLQHASWNVCDRFCYEQRQEYRLYAHPHSRG